MLPNSNASSGRLAALAADIAGCGTEPVAAALDHELAAHAAGFAAGLEAYRRHPYRRAAAEWPVLWREGGSRLLDYGGNPARPAALVVPSLVNRYHVLDLLPERSFLGQLAAGGLRPLVIDWGEPGAAEAGLDLAGYVARLERALAAASEAAGGRAALIGYCMGGLLAVAAALRRPQQLACLALLATPWDFHAERSVAARLLGALGRQLPRSESAALPVDFVQSLFLLLDPFLAARKFRRFAELDAESAAARGFVALEDWINDGVPLAMAVARECLAGWYGDNAAAHGRWQVAGTRILPQRLRLPTLVVVPDRDRIVPPAAAEPLAAIIPGAELLRAPLGHIGMMAGSRARELVWSPLGQWLGAQLAGPGGRLDSAAGLS